MMNCPTCGAAWAGKPVCSRCKTDLGLILETQRRADEQRAVALAAFQAEDSRRMFQAAHRAFALMKTDENRKVLACAALMDRQFDMALSLWRSGNESKP